MSTQDDDDLRLEPPRVPPQPPPAPAPEAPVYQPPAPPAAQAGQPQGADDDLEPGAGRPLVEGPPMSVGEPIPERSINSVAAIAAAGLVGLLVIALLVVVFAVCLTR